MFSTLKSSGQTLDCPTNIGFEQGSFQNWQIDSGRVSLVNNVAVINLTPTSPVNERHVIVSSDLEAKDLFGNFPINAPNGSGYAVRLGYTVSGQRGDRVSYTFTVPANQNAYSLIFNYAVVFFNPATTDVNDPRHHNSEEQPKFSVKVFDAASNEPTGCGSFDFVSSSDLPGFEESTVRAGVFFKPWSPVTINLSGYAGKSIRIEFTTNGCTKDRGQHFGYAYIDVNENCDSPITGNTYCDPSSLTLAAPSGFKEYHWYNADFTQLMGTGNTLKLIPAPPINTSYSVRIVPYPGLGCLDTLYTTIKPGEEVINFNVDSTLEECFPKSVDLTTATNGSGPGLKYTYFTDAEATIFVRAPKIVSESGTYYIKATNATGCFKIKPVKVLLNLVKLQITDPLPACFPGTVDLTSAALTVGSDADIEYTYWKDINAETQLTNPNAVDISGTYYIKATNGLGCYVIKPIYALITDMVVRDQSSCLLVDLTAASVTVGSSFNFTYTYWKDTDATEPLLNPSAVNVSGTYYIKGTNSGCSKTLPVQVIVFPLPNLELVNPAPVIYPKTIDLTALVGSSSDLISYWKNQEANIPLQNPENVGLSGIYYIRAINTNGCKVIVPITIIVNAPPIAQVVAANVFTPNNDGTNDLFSVTMIGTVHVNSFTIYNRWGQLIFKTAQISNFWDGTLNGQNQPMGIYYWVLDGVDIYRNQKVTKSGPITLIR